MTIPGIEIPAVVPEGEWSEIYIHDSEFEKIAPPFRMPGGKHWSKLAILKVIPDHSRYIEPFLGAGSVFLAKEPSTSEIISDKDPGIVFFWRYVQKHGDSRLPILRRRFDWSVQINGYEKFAQIKAMKPRDDDERFFRFLFLQESSWRGDRETFQPSLSIWKHTVLDNLKSYKERLNGVRILKDDFQNILRRFGSSDSFAFLDPPYEQGDIGRRTTTREGEWFGHVDPEIIKTALARFTGRYLMTLSDSDFWKSFSFPRGARVRKVRVLKKNIRGGGGTSRYELWVSNFDLPRIAKMGKRIFEGRFREFVQGTPGVNVEGQGSRGSLAVIGDAPGRIELERGEPLSGPSGDLVRKILAGEGFDPAGAYWDNVFQTAIPSLDDEAIEDNRAQFEGRMRKATPTAYLALGLVAAKALVPSLPDEPIGSLVGKKFESFDGKPVFVTWHPAYVLRRGQLENAPGKQLKEDVLLAVRESAFDRAKALPEPVRKQLLHGKFILQRRYWRVRQVVREGPTEEFWHVRLRFPGRKDEQYLLESTPLGGASAEGTYSDSEDSKAFERTGEFDPQQIGPPKPEKIGPVFIGQVDSGDVTQFEFQDGFKRYEFKGDKFKGLWNARDEGGGIWSFVPAKTALDEIEKNVEAVLRFAKRDDEKQIVFTVVYRPREVDLQREWISKADVEDMAHQWMQDFLAGKVSYDFMHKSDEAYPRDMVFPVENFVHRGPPLKWGAETLIDGDWAQGIKILDSDLWRRIKSGEIEGVSIAGSARAEMVTPT